MSLLFGIPLVLFAALQGSVVFGTAYGLSDATGQKHWFAKIAFMAFSYVGWILFTFAGWMMLGGQGGIMDGGMIPIMLSITALVSSAVYLIGWLAAPVIRKAR